ncbi:2-oxoglutarate and iron-dependent oxygenase domain-containing protein 1 [Plakobranchus ocellatus]|uniref:2-oxoglutarate and iron-dependent oxygenase domain-containing protein 1 n=1 Tax=Plakobranchus ocellatus TaxID=259542 RepID=A0AAV4D9D0_9GAST|nr:2-oxoglutarate and iron-dependent oxygenase domain-containing protein 1 [Plakobranchus ocellatus]
MISEIYVQTDVKKRFEEDSEIELTDFLQEEKYKALMAALEDDKIDWSLVGPANKRNFYLAEQGKLPLIVAEFLRIIQSDAAFLVLSNLTGLRLHPLAPTDDEGDNDSGSNSVSNGGGNPRCRTEVRRWEHGCYTLAHDTDSEMQDFALDVMMYVGCDNEWSFDNGGYTSYIAKGEDDELLSVCPSGNSLALVYRDKDTMRFVKHMNHRVTKLSLPRFYEINSVYYE